MYTNIYNNTERRQFKTKAAFVQTQPASSVCPQKCCCFLNVFQPVAHTPTLMKCLEKLLRIKGTISTSLDPHQLSHPQRMPTPLPPTLGVPLIVPNYVFSRLHLSPQNGSLSANNKALNELECTALNALSGGIRGKVASDWSAVLSFLWYNWSKVSNLQNQLQLSVFLKHT